MTAKYYARHNDSNEWSTPEPIFAGLDKEFGFDLDVAASRDHHRCARYFTREQDGLTQPWSGVCWLNPPCGRAIGKWIEKAVQEARRGVTTVCLVPARTDTDWWHRWVQEYAAEIRFIKGRIRFNNGTGRAPFPSAVIIFKPWDAAAVGARVGPRHPVPTADALTVLSLEVPA